MSVTSYSITGDAGDKRCEITNVIKRADGEGFDRNTATLTPESAIDAIQVLASFLNNHTTSVRVKYTIKRGVFGDAS